jgi:hypothetical protein
MDVSKVLESMEIAAYQATKRNVDSRHRYLIIKRSVPVAVNIYITPSAIGAMRHILSSNKPDVLAVIKDFIDTKDYMLFELYDDFSFSQII